MVAGQRGSKRSSARIARCGVALVRAVQHEPQRARVRDRGEPDRDAVRSARRRATRTPGTSRGCRGASSRRARTTVVVPSRGEPGGRNATWPSDAPDARRNRSMPPAAAIRVVVGGRVVRIRQPHVLVAGCRAAPRSRAARSRGSCSARPAAARARTRPSSRSSCRRDRLRLAERAVGRQQAAAAGAPEQERPGSSVDDLARERPPELVRVREHAHLSGHAAPAPARSDAVAALAPSAAPTASRAASAAPTRPGAHPARPESLRAATPPSHDARAGSPLRRAASRRRARRPPRRAARGRASARRAMSTISSASRSTSARATASPSPAAATTAGASSPRRPSRRRR